MVVIKNSKISADFYFRSSDMEPQTYDINYQLNKHTYYVMHSPMDHAYMHHLIMYPIFQPFARTFIKEVMRIMSKTCFFQKIYPQFCSNEVATQCKVLFVHSCNALGNFQDYAFKISVTLNIFCNMITIQTTLQNNFKN